MKIPQLSIFIENRPGKLGIPCKVLAKEGVNILTLSLADTQQFGILRLIVRDWEKAKAVLEGAGCAVRVNEVIAIEVEDRPGGLVEILKVFEGASINVEYMYAFTLRRGDKAVLVFSVDRINEAIAALQNARIGVIAHVDLYDRLENH